MDEIPEGPTGDEIARAVDARGVTLSWAAYKPGSRVVERPAAVALVLILCGWAVVGAGITSALANGRWPPLFLLWLCVWVLGGLCLAWQLWVMLRPPTPESVRLEADALKYAPGCGPSEGRSCAELPDGKVVPVTPAPAARIAKNAIRNFDIDRTDERERLYVYTDGRRFEIGGCLTGPERAWLLTVLRQWLGTSSPVRPWMRGARHEEGSQA